MAFLRWGIGDSDSDIGPVSLSREILGAIRWAAIPCTVVFFASWSAATVAGLHSATSRASTESFLPTTLATQAPAVREAAHQPRIGATNHRKAARASVETASIETASVEAAGIETPATEAPADPFAEAIARAKLSRESVLAAFADAGMTVADPADPFARVIADARPSREKMLAALAGAGLEIPGAPAYAAADAGPDNPVELALASLGDDPFDMEPGIDVEAETMPDTVELPPARPRVAKPAAPEKPVTATAKPRRDRTRTAAATAPRPAAPEPRQRTRSPREEPQALAYARPNNPTGGAFGKLFRSPNVGDKVAVYDISAATVHMPDGSKLRAHSGIGHMADNPRYVHVKNKGPTPPNTYRLTMREKRFHGVEAIRMTPIGEETMHGRDGILAHSFLLRGGRPESHGCVAFADYPKFLNAFKQGKVTHMIVVPSMSKMPKVQMVSTSGRGA